MAIKILGVDFRRNAVSAALIRGSYKGVWIDGHAHVFLERPEAIDKGLASCLDILSEHSDMSHAVCIAALPSDRFFYRNITSPFADLRKIDQTLPYELEQSLPLPADDLILDFFPVSHAVMDRKFMPRFKQLIGLGSRTAATRILTAAIEKAHLAAYLACFRQFGLEPECIVPGGYPLCLCLMHAENSPSNWLLVDTDKTHTALFLVLSQALTVIRAFPGSGLPPSAASLFPLIQQTLLSSGKKISIDRIFLTGGLSDAVAESQSTASAVAAMLSEKCGIPVHPMNLVADADVRLKSDLPSYWNPETGDPALGTAFMRMIGLSGLNLRKGPFGLKTPWAACRSGLLRTGVMAGLAVLAALAYVRSDTQNQEKQLDFLNRRITKVLTDTFPQITAVVDPLHQMRTHVQNASGRRPGSDGNQPEHLVDILARISSRIPESIPVELVRLVYEDSFLQLAGHTDSFNSVEEIKRRLEGPNGGFALVTIVSANQDNTGNRIQFHLNIKI